MDELPLVIKIFLIILFLFVFIGFMIIIIYSIFESSRWKEIYKRYPIKGKRNISWQGGIFATINDCSFNHCLKYNVDNNSLSLSLIFGLGGIIEIPLEDINFEEIKFRYIFKAHKITLKKMLNQEIILPRLEALEFKLKQIKKKKL